MSNVNDQSFTVELTLTVRNLGDDKTEREVGHAVLKALDGLPLNLDYTLETITVTDEDESKE